MSQWGTFAGLTGVVLVLVLVLSYLTQTAFDDERAARDAGATQSAPGPVDADPREGREPATASESATEARSVPEDGLDGDADEFVEPGESSVATEPDESGRTLEPNESDAAVEPDEFPEPRDGYSNERDRRGARTPGSVRPESFSTGELLANVAVSQGLFALVLIGGIVYTGIPAGALGIAFTREYLLAGLVVGTVLGVVLYVANELGAASAERVGFDHDERLRELLAPETAGGWVVLLGVVLPIIAIFEELLFRAALIGALSAGFDVSPWLLAVGSSIAFGVGHGMQGRIGIVVTGTLGFALAAAFILTESLLVVIVAHYLINALEFVVHEGLDLEWAETLGS